MKDQTNIVSDINTIESLFQKIKERVASNPDNVAYQWNTIDDAMRSMGIQSTITNAERLAFALGRLTAEQYDSK